MQELVSVICKIRTNLNSSAMLLEVSKTIWYFQYYYYDAILPEKVKIQSNTNIYTVNKFLVLKYKEVSCVVLQLLFHIIIQSVIKLLQYNELMRLQ